jgi:hypothetical protein
VWGRIGGDRCRAPGQQNRLGAPEAVIALEFAHQPDDAIERLQIARHHRRMGDDHRIAQPPDLGLQKSRRGIDLAREQNLPDH